jgi:hypothetical protein
MLAKPMTAMRIWLDAHDVEATRDQARVVGAVGDVAMAT